MNPRQQRFAEEYAANGNGKQAAINAGYAPKTAAAQASRLLTNANIQKFIKTRTTKTSNKLELTQRYVLDGLMGIAANDGQAVSARVRAYELLGKHQGMFGDQIEISQLPNEAQVLEWLDAVEAHANSDS